MDSESLFLQVRGALERGVLTWDAPVVRHQAGHQLALSEAGGAILESVRSRASPATGSLSLEEGALLQLLAFSLLDAGRVSPVIDYGSLLGDGQGIPLQPREVSLEITRLCNLRCLHCYNDSGERDAAELSDREKLALVDHLARWGVRRLTITGGEPLLDPCFGSLLSIAGENGVALKVTTNGWVLPEAFLAAIDGGTVVAVNLSLDGADEATHDAFRGKKGSYERVLRAMRILSERRPPALKLNVSVHRGSVHQMEAIARLALDHRFDGVSFKPVTSSGRKDGRRDFFLSEADLRSFREERARLGTLLAGRLQIEGNVLGGAVPESALDTIGCNAAERSMLIKSDGEMTPCDALKASSWAPNVRDTSPVRAWLTHPLFMGFRTLKRTLGAPFVGCPGVRFSRIAGERREPRLDA